MGKYLLPITLLLVLVAGLALPGCAAEEEEMVIRWSTDHSATQGSGYGELEVLKPKLEELIPNAKVQMYHSSALYKPVESLNQAAAGNLELALVDSDGAPWDPYMNIWAQPMVLSTVGAHMEFPNTEVARALEDRFLSKGVRVLGWEVESMLGGLCSSERILTLDDLEGKKVRISAALTQAPMVESFGANPNAIAWGDVPSALQTGVVDGVITSVGGYNNIKDLAPYYTVWGMGGVFTDFYIIGASEEWWQTLSPETQGLIMEAIDHFIGVFYEMQYAEDQLGYQKLGTEDPSQPGIYLATPEEIAPLQEAVGTSIIDNLVKEIGEEARPLAELFVEEGQANVEKYPTGTHPIEQIDVEQYREILRMEN